MLHVMNMNDNFMAEKWSSAHNFTTDGHAPFIATINIIKKLYETCEASVAFEIRF